MKKKVIVELDEDCKLAGVFTEAEVEVIVVDFSNHEKIEGATGEQDFVVPIDSVSNLPSEVKRVLHYENGEAFEHVPDDEDEADEGGDGTWGLMLDRES